MMHDTRLRSTGSEFRIGFLGRLVARKGAHFLLPLLRPVSESIGREVQLSIAGAGPLAGSLDRQARKLGVRHQVDLLGSIADEERHSFMASQDVMAFPAASGESFGIVLGEAMRSSVPVLAGNNAGYAATMASIEDQLVDFRDQPRAIAALSKLAKLSGTERSELLERQATRVSAFAPDVVGAAMLSLYRQTQDSVRI
jgi:glycosyltransferase involved in cell wall biosynthesis